MGIQTRLKKALRAFGRAVLVSLLLLVTISCQRDILLHQAYPTVQSLGRDLMQAASANSDTDWQKVFISAQEFQDLIYPHLPEASGPGKIEAADYWAWIYLDILKSKKRLFQMLKGAEILSVETGEPKKILRQGRYRIWRDIPLKVKYRILEKDGHSSGERELASREILKAVIEANGQFKLWNSTFER